MAVPSSGQLSLRSIKRELVYDNYYYSAGLANVSLKDTSDGTVDTINTHSDSYPNGVAPHGMSEFYSYDHDATGLTSFTSSLGHKTQATACGLSLNQTYYHNGSGTFPAIGDQCYSNSAGTTALIGKKHYRMGTGTFYISTTLATVHSVGICS
tara:strand:+ start:22409 stop:22867 length:459 start_codon:yes stop_codon:yes gene_type:complete